MKIRTLWETSPDAPNNNMPWLVTAVDEYTEEEHDGTPEFYQRELDKNTKNRRELIIEVPEKVVQKLFETPVQQAMAAYPPRRRGSRSADSLGHLLLVLRCREARRSGYSVR